MTLKVIPLYRLSLCRVSLSRVHLESVPLKWVPLHGKLALCELLWSTACVESDILLWDHWDALVLTRSAFPRVVVLLLLIHVCLFWLLFNQRWVGALLLYNTVLLHTLLRSHCVALCGASNIGALERLAEVVPCGKADYLLLLDGHDIDWGLATVLPHFVKTCGCVLSIEWVCLWLPHLLVFHCSSLNYSFYFEI